MGSSLAIREANWRGFAEGSECPKYQHALRRALRSAQQIAGQSFERSQLVLAGDKDAPVAVAII